MLRIGATNTKKTAEAPPENRPTVELIRDAYGWAQAPEPATWGPHQRRYLRGLMIRASLAIIILAALALMLLSQSH